MDELRAENARLRKALESITELPFAEPHSFKIACDALEKVE